MKFTCREQRAICRTVQKEARKQLSLSRNLPSSTELHCCSAQVVVFSSFWLARILSCVR
jgi:hypothetical protein